MGGRLAMDGMKLAELNEPPMLPSAEVMEARQWCGEPPCSLAEFVVMVWPVLNPATPLIWNWHLRVICDHVQAQLEGGRFGAPWAQNLDINVPPGSSKSTIVSVCAPTWKWTWSPSWRVLCLSGNPDVATRDSLASRRIVESETYQLAFRPRWQLASDQNLKTYFQNTATGFRQAKGFSAQVTGDRPDALIIDDPIDAKEVVSEVERDRVNRDYDTAIGGRISDPQRGTRTNIMQRLHEDDLSAHVRAHGEDWEHLRIEQERELQASCECVTCRRGATFLGFRDPRGEEGELMDPVRFPRTALAQERRRLGPDYAGQQQQRPVPKGGVMFDPKKIGVLPEMPSAAQIKRQGRGWDLAASELGAWTAGVKLLELVDGRFVVADVVRFRSEPGEVERVMLATATQDGRACPIVGPQDPGQAGIGQAASLTKLLRGFMAFFVRQTGDKVVRATPFSRQVAIGNVSLVEADWNQDYLAECAAFPRGKYKDQVDATAEIFNWMSGESAGVERARALLEMRLR